MTKLLKSINEIWTGSNLINKLPKITVSIPDAPRGGTIRIFVVNFGYLVFIAIQWRFFQKTSQAHLPVFAKKRAKIKIKSNEKPKSKMKMKHEIKTDAAAAGAAASAAAPGFTTVFTVVSRDAAAEAAVPAAATSVLISCFTFISNF